MFTRVYSSLVKKGACTVLLPSQPRVQIWLTFGHAVGLSLPRRFFVVERGSFFVNATMYTNACDLSSRAPGHGSGQPHLIGGNRRLDALHGQVDGGIVQVCNFSVVAATPCRRHVSRGRVPHRWGEARSARAVVSSPPFVSAVLSSQSSGVGSLKSLRTRPYHPAARRALSVYLRVCSSSTASSSFRPDAGIVAARGLPCLVSPFRRPPTLCLIFRKKRAACAP